MFVVVVVNWWGNVGRGDGGVVTAKGYSRTKHKQSSYKSRDEEHLLANSDTFIHLIVNISSPKHKHIFA